MVTEKRISRMKRTFFIDNVKNMFVLSILQTVRGTSPLSKFIALFDVLYNWKTIFLDKTVLIASTILYDMMIILRLVLYYS